VDDDDPLTDINSEEINQEETKEEYVIPQERDSGIGAEPCHCTSWIDVFWDLLVRFPARDPRVRPVPSRASTTEDESRPTGNGCLWGSSVIPFT
jgi:hypothetical protein